MRYLVLLLFCCLDKCPDCKLKCKFEILHIKFSEMRYLVLLLPLLAGLVLTAYLDIWNLTPWFVTFSEMRYLVLLLPLLAGLAQCSNTKECNAQKDQFNKCTEAWVVVTIKTWILNLNLNLSSNLKFSLTKNWVKSVQHTMLSKMQLQLRVGLSILSSPSQNYDHFSSFFKHGQLDFLYFSKTGRSFWTIFGKREFLGWGFLDFPKKFFCFWNRIND